MRSSLSRTLRLSRGDGGRGLCKLVVSCQGDRLFQNGVAKLTVPNECPFVGASNGVLQFQVGLAVRSFLVLLV